MTRNENYTKWYKLQKCCLPVMVAHASWYSRGCCWKEDVRNTNARSGIKETKKNLRYAPNEKGVQLLA